jgi:hypothetical protein
MFPLRRDGTVLDDTYGDALRDVGTYKSFRNNIFTVQRQKKSPYVKEEKDKESEIQYGILQTIIK